MPAVELGPAAEDVARDGFAADCDVLLPEEGPLPEAKRQRTDEKSDAEPASSSARSQRSGACGGSLHNTGRGKNSQARVRAYLRQGLDRYGCCWLRDC